MRRLTIGYLLLHALDIVLTMVGLDMSATEINPIMRYVLDQEGWVAVILIKILVCFGILWYLSWFPVKQSWFILLGLAVIQSLVVAWDAMQLIRGP